MNQFLANVVFFVFLFVESLVSVQTIIPLIKILSFCCHVFSKTERLWVWLLLVPWFFFCLEIKFRRFIICSTNLVTSIFYFLKCYLQFSLIHLLSKLLKCEWFFFVTKKSEWLNTKNKYMLIKKLEKVLKLNGVYPFRY